MLLHSSIIIIKKIPQYYKISCPFYSITSSYIIRRQIFYTKGQNIKNIILLLLPLLLYSANIKDELIAIQNQQEILEEQIDKYFWLNDITLNMAYIGEKEYDFRENKKKLSIEFSQDIYKGGELRYTYKKNILKKHLRQKKFLNKLNQKKRDISKLVLKLKKTDLKLQQTNYLLLNNLLKIETKDDSFLLIEKYELENTLEDLKINKHILLSSLDKISKKKYKDIDIINTEIFSLDDLFSRNNIKDIHDLNLKISKLDKKIQNAKSLPQVSFYSKIGYRIDKYKDSKYNDSWEEEDNFYNYGFYLSYPLNFNKSKKEQLASLKYLEKRTKQNISKENVKSNYIQIKKELDAINKKINNQKKIYILKETMYLKNKLEDMNIIINNLKYEKINISILKIEKQLLFYDFWNI